MAFRTESMDVAPVKGSPFCATIVNEHTQVFADGNKIHTTENSSLCRDSEGRTRRESQLNLLGAVSQDSVPKLVTISDPVAGFRYHLDSVDKTAAKMPMPTIAMAGGKGVAGATAHENILFINAGKPGAELPPPLPPPGGGANVVFERKVVQGGPSVAGSNEAPPKTENLGDQTINGIHATGTRVTTVIPAGQMGNEQPINVVSEDWYSPELKATIMTKHTDPWSGTLTTQFTNVSTSEPDASMFTVPSDYKIIEDKEGPMVIKFKSANPPSSPQ